MRAARAQFHADAPWPLHKQKKHDTCAFKASISKKYVRLGTFGGCTGRRHRSTGATRGFPSLLPDLREYGG